jgi:Transposase DDE domain
MSGDGARRCRLLAPQADRASHGDGFLVLVAPDSMVREGGRPGSEGGMYSFMRRVLSTDLGRELYIKRRHSIDPVFGQIKHNRGMTHFRRRGRVAARSEWRLIAATTIS